jgi:DNA-binding GntR family transcriptional regulator
MASAYDRLKKDILDGKLPGGQPLVEATLAGQYGVSRTPIREALHRLQQDELVERGNRGLIVAERSADQILEIYEARMALEAAAAEAAARHRSDIDLARLKGLLDVAPRSDPSAEQMASYNRQFHEAIWNASHNRTLVDLLARLFIHLRRYPSTTLTFPGRWDEALVEHEALVEAIEAHDAERASQIGREHMSRARDVRLAMWRDSPTGEDGVL